MVNPLDTQNKWERGSARARRQGPFCPRGCSPMEDDEQPNTAESSFGCQVIKAEPLSGMECTPPGTDEASHTHGDASGEQT